jgi:hypothetical protein
MLDILLLIEISFVFCLGARLLDDTWLLGMTCNFVRLYDIISVCLNLFFFHWNRPRI